MIQLVTLLPLFLIVMCASLSAQKRLLDVKFTTFKHPAPGYFFFAPSSPDSIGLIDHAGKNVFAARASQPCTFQSDDTTATHFIANRRLYVRRNAHMQVIDTLRMSGPYEVNFHESHILPNGNYIILGVDDRTMDLSTVVPGGSTEARVSGAVVQERTFSGTTVFEWKSLDYIPVTDATQDVDLTQRNIDYIHVNSVNVDRDGNYLISCRHLDEVIKVNKATGAVMWRLGGSKSKRNQFTFIDDTAEGFTGFSHQHDVSRTASGNLLMLDNGNLKPTPYSRAVEYELNETLKTAKRTWSFRPTPDIFTFSMGSVQELPNGNVLMGWGQSSSDILAQEVSRDGTIQAEIRTDSAKILSYRVRKSVFAMSGTERLVSTPGTYTFATGDSNTRVSVVLTRVDTPTSLIAERHSYAPHKVSYSNAAPCLPLAMRWVVRISDSSKIAGSSRFALGALPADFLPTHARLYWRPVEGVGTFTELATTLDAPNNQLVTASIRSGEFLVGFVVCLNPLPLQPTANAVSQTLTPMLVWSEAVTSDGYDIEVYRGANPVPQYAFKTQRLDTTIGPLDAGTAYQWRVRSRRPSDNPWSTLASFRTRIEPPTPLMPTSLPDSSAVSMTPLFSWSSIPLATGYHLQVYNEEQQAPVIDTVLTATQLQTGLPLEPHAWFSWQVRTLVDSHASAWSSRLMFVTVPDVPRLIEPAIAQLQVEPSAASLVWSDVHGAERYHVRIFRNDDAEPFHDDTVADNQTVLAVLDNVTRYFWQVQTASRFGTSAWSAKRWFATSGQSSLQTPVLFSPINMATTDTLNPTLSWSAIDGASHYYVQLTSTPTFESPEFEWLDVADVTKSVEQLESGRLYLWRAAAISGTGTSSWSLTGQFITQAAPDDKLRPISPINGAREVRTQTFAAFVTDPSFTGYRAEFSTSPDFSAIAHSIGGAISPLPITLNQGTEYWWRIVGIQNGVDVDTGLSASFTTVFPTSVHNISNASQPLAVQVHADHLEFSDVLLGGSSILVVDLVGRLEASASIPFGTTHYRMPFRSRGIGLHAVVVMQPNGVTRLTTIVQDGEALVGR